MGLLQVACCLICMLDIREKTESMWHLIPTFWPPDTAEFRKLHQLRLQPLGPLPWRAVPNHFADHQAMQYQHNFLPHPALVDFV